MEIRRIVITGGPCGGKSSALERVKKDFSALGWTVLTVPETATELISGGVAPWTCGTPTEYQRYQMHLQREKERAFVSAAKNMPAEKILIVCDRGMLDNLAYMSLEDFKAIAAEMGESLVAFRDSYDAVFHLVTAADGAECAYTTANNSARIETPAEARDLDARVISAWTGHPHFRVVDNSTDFEGKLSRLTAEIAVFLGEPEPREIERKFLIEYPDTAYLEGLPNCARTEIVQTYLKTAPGRVERIRQRGQDGDFVFFHTVKYGSGTKRMELEERISREEYLALLLRADPARRSIVKSRFCLTHGGKYFEIDVFPFWSDKAYLEIELKTEDEEFAIPDFIKVIRDVTDEKEYGNAALAARLG